MKIINLKNRISSIDSIMNELNTLEMCCENSEALKHCLSFEDMNELLCGADSIRRKLNDAKAWAVKQYNDNVFQFIHTNNKGECTRFHGTKEEIIKCWHSVGKNAIVLELYFNDARAPICGHNDIGKFLFGK